MTERREPAAHPIRDLLAHFDQLHQQAVGVRYAVNGAKDAKLLKDLRELYSDEQLRGFMDAYFASDDPFIQSAGYSVGVFRACLPKIIKAALKPASLVQQNADVMADLMGRAPLRRVR